MTGAVQAFQPAGTVTVAASATSAFGVLPTGGDAVLVTNATVNAVAVLLASGSGNVFVTRGSGTAI